tara:strand:- start:2221 stop:2823 length:603 start_codon:yes stop_codon:yes gene_type:complete
MKKIGILNIGYGNVNRLKSSLQKINLGEIVLVNKNNLCEVEVLFLPGVGNFHEVSKLYDKMIRNYIINHIDNGSKVIGICVGMQLLFSSSEEGNGYGLNLIDGKVKKILGNEEPVPNIGQLIPIWQNFLIPEFIKENYYYHTHSYYCNVTDKNCSVLASIHYNKISIPVIIKKNNLLGFQFHPELSNYQGLALLKYFVNE